MVPGSNREEQAGFINRYGGIIFIDEIDKKAADRSIVGHDISREGFQRSILKLIERKLIPIHSPYSPVFQIQEIMQGKKEKKTEKQETMISTENILFIFGGSFERAHDDLDSIVKKRIQHQGRLNDDGSVEIMGFSDLKNTNKGKLQNYYKETEADDFIKFGMLPELVGRSPIRTFVNLLSKNDLVRIMQGAEDSILNQYSLEFKLFDIAVEFTPEAVEYVAEISENRKTGARALVSVWENILTPFQFELPGSNFAKLKVTRELCERPEDTLLKLLEKSPFVDFLDNFRREYGIELILEEDIQNFIEEQARETNAQISEILKKLFFAAAALNYMGIREPFKIEKKMIQDDKYFDKLFSKWYEDQKKT